ncbi:leucocin A/sakacin P family class II bacteriocin [Enterococcus faecalis]|nr:leucocin A/sakacin P family class II bacteriocin [Enterococcus faecalis]
MYCNKQKCWVDWSKVITIIGNNAVANWATRGHAGWNY